MIERLEIGGNIVYKLNGMLHRPNGPASEWADGVAGWYLFNSYHRYYGAQDAEEWWIHGKQLK